jgi:multidrug efflux system outer membrane protein
MKPNTFHRSAVRRLLLAAAPLVLIAGCTMGPEYKQPPVSAPQTFRDQIGPADAASIADLPWWGVFNDPPLQALIADGLHNNYDLQVAVSRIEQARQIVLQSQSQGAPQIGYNLGGAGQENIVAGANSAVSATYGTFGGVINAAWEFDVWGRIKRSTEAAQANLLGQEDIRRGVMLTLVTDIAAGYFRLVELDRELAIDQDSVANYGRTLDLFNDRYKAGKDSELPVQRSQALYQSAQANVSTLQRQITQQENALTVLVGRPPGPIERGRVLTEQTMPATPVGETTALLKRRPDILAAEQTMVNANAEIGEALADFYPKIGLSALVGGDGVTFGEGVQGFGVWGLALSAAGPIFTGGRLQAIYHQRQAFWDETVADYHKTILTAFQETSDALIAQQTLVGQRERLEAQIVALQRSVSIARLRYDNGRAGYFEVLEAEQQLYPAEYQLAQTQRDQLLAVVSLYKALGGGWSIEANAWAKPQPG